MPLREFIKERFGVEEETFLDAMKLSPGSMGAIAGAIAEILLKKMLEEKEYEVLRIKEKPAGGNDAKAEGAKGDFYIRKRAPLGKWYVVECKGLKTNSEFRGSKWCNKESVYKYLKSLAFPKSKSEIMINGKEMYDKAKKKHEKEMKERGISFPMFKWDERCPGANNADLTGLWKTDKDLKEWVNKQDESLFTEEKYRKRQGVILNLETHKPSRRLSPSGILQTGPLVSDFSILAVDLFFRTAKHQFVYVNPERISHSPSSPEHLYQNYTIDVLVPGVKEELKIRYPWFQDIDKLIEETNPSERELDETQLDKRREDEYISEEEE